MSRFQRSIIVGGGVCFLLCAVQLRSSATHLLSEIIEDEERFYLPPAQWLQAFSLGYNEAFADLIWLKTVVYFGELARNKWQGGARDNYTLNYLAAATELDPKFKGLYTHGSVLTLYHQGKITRRAAEMAIEILEKGVREFPTDGEIAFRLGFIHYYEIQLFGDHKQDPEFQAHKERGLRMIRRAALLDNAPKYVTLLSSSLLQKAGMRELVIEHLRQLLLKETNPNIRHSLEQQLIRELGQAASRDIVMGRRLQAQWHQSLPFAEFEVFLILHNGTDTRSQELLDPLHRSNSVLGIVEDHQADSFKP